MKITQEVREFAKSGMAEMSEKFKATGGKIYVKADETKPADAAE